MSNFLSTSEIVRKGGGTSALARRIGVAPQSISKWIAKGLVPIERVPAVSDATGLPRHVIRPDRRDLFPPPEHSGHAA